MKLPKRSAPISEGNGSNLFLRLKDGESITGICRGEVYTFFNRWTGKTSEVVSEDAEGAKPRYRVNFVTVEEGVLVAKIWEFPNAVLEQLEGINDEYPLEKTKIKITRRGTGTDTIYMILPLLKEPISPKAMKEIEAVHMNILEHKQKPSTETREQKDQYFEEEEVPF